MREKLSSLLFLWPLVVSAQDAVLQAKPLVESSWFSQDAARRDVLRRIQAGVYEGYKADLCVDDPKPCSAAVFDPYKVEGKNEYSLIIRTAAWSALPPAVADAAVREIIYYAWGHVQQQFPPLDVVERNGLHVGSPLRHLSPNSSERYLRFANPAEVQGGLGKFSYGPNCWFTAISTVADSRSSFAKANLLATNDWTRSRFMGPQEFRMHISDFVEVTQPQFGDLIRYYTKAPITKDSEDIYAGEVHAAVYVGLMQQGNRAAAKNAPAVVLTKNGRSDLDFLIFQDMRGLDEMYLRAKGSTATSEDERVRKGYFRVRPGASIQNPVTAGMLSQAYAGHLVDVKNYADRFLCLAGLIGTPAGEGRTCMNYPAEWSIYSAKVLRTPGMK